MRKHNPPALIGTLATFSWLALAIYVSYTHNPVAEWIFIAITTLLISSAIAGELIERRRLSRPRR